MATSKRKSQASPAQGGQVSLFALSEPADAFRKAVEILHSKPKRPMTLMGRKILDHWLKLASRGDPDPNGWYEVNIMAMSRSIGFDSNNRDHLKQSAIELMQTIFEWDVVNKTSKRFSWKASVLFPEVEIVGGVLRFQVSSQLLTQVRNPAVFASIDETILRRFRRGATIAIYQHCVRYINVGRTAEVKWQEFRDIILGESIGAPAYVEYKYFKSRVLKPGIAEVNAVSDIQIELLEVRGGKWVESIKFTVHVKPEAIEHAIDDVQSMAVMGELIKLGVPQSEARKTLVSHGEDAVTAALNYTKRRASDTKSAKLDNPAAYFRQALLKKWATAEDVVVKEDKTSAKDGQTQLRDRFMAAQDVEAQSYFKELDLPDQTQAMERYNAQQAVAGLQIKPKKPSKAALAAFYRWLGRDVWGEATDAAVVEFAGRLLAKA